MHGGIWTRSDPDDGGYRGVQDTIQASGPDWKAVVVGVVATFVSLAVLAAIGILLIWSEAASDLMRSNGGRTIALYAVAGVVPSFAFGAWLGVRKHAPRNLMLVGPAIASIVLLCLFAVGAPLVVRMADFQSVAIALGIIDAPNIGTGPSEALHHLSVTRGDSSGPADEHVVTTALVRVRQTAWYLVGAMVSIFY